MLNWSQHSAGWARDPPPEFPFYPSNLAMKTSWLFWTTTIQFQLTATKLGLKWMAASSKDIWKTNWILKFYWLEDVRDLTPLMWVCWDESGRQKDIKTERQKDRKTERQKDRKTERQKDRKTERQKDRKSETKNLILNTCFLQNWAGILTFWILQIAIISRRSESFRYHVEKGVAKATRTPLGTRFLRSDGTEGIFRDYALPTHQFQTQRTEGLSRAALPAAGLL